MKPIFIYSEQIIESEKAFFYRQFGINISGEFLKCADVQLKKKFELETGLKVSKNISTSFVQPENFFYEKDTISKMPINIYINHNWNTVSILWKSKSGRLYTIEDSDIDCDDVEFSFAGLNPLLYHKQLFPEIKVPFKLKDLSYELIITRLNMEMEMEMVLKPEVVDQSATIINVIDKFINSFNINSEKREREYGVVHNWKRHTEGEKLVYEIDTGSAGVGFLKKMLQYLSGLNYFLKIKIE